MSRTASLALGAVVVLAVLAAPAGTALAVGPYVSISSATVSPSSPAPGDVVTVSATVRDLASSSSDFQVYYVRLLGGSGSVRDVANNLGTIAPGSELQVPLTTTFARPGTYHLRVEAHGSNDVGAEKTVYYPVVVHVRERAPAVEVSASNAVAGAASPVTVTVANGLGEDMRNLRVDLSGAGVTTSPSRRVAPTLASGSSTRLTFNATAATTGTHNLTARVRYDVGAGTEETSYTAPVSFASLRDSVALSTRTVGDGSSLAVTVSDLGNAAVRDVSVRGDSPNATVTGADVPRVPAGGSRTVVLNASGFTGETSVHLTATYDYGSGTRSGTASADATVAANPGSVRLTGLDLERSGGKLHVTGSASNVGLSAVNSVVVRVVPAAGVQPAYPGREYFVGTIPASDFVSFDVYATTSANATSVPLEVTYLADGVRHRTTTRVPIADASSGGPAASGGGTGGGGGWLLPGIVGVVVLAGVAALIYVGWRNYVRDE